jgi:hypothetical protein
MSRDGDRRRVFEKERHEEFDPGFKSTLLRVRTAREVGGEIPCSNGIPTCGSKDGCCPSYFDRYSTQDCPERETERGSREEAEGK